MVDRTGCFYRKHFLTSCWLAKCPIRCRMWGWEQPGCSRAHWRCGYPGEDIPACRDSNRPLLPFHTCWASTSLQNKDLPRLHVFFAAVDSLFGLFWGWPVLWELHLKTALKAPVSSRQKVGWHWGLLDSLCTSWARPDASDPARRWHTLLPSRQFIPDENHAYEWYAYPDTPSMCLHYCFCNTERPNSITMPCEPAISSHKSQSTASLHIWRPRAVSYVQP